VHNFIRGAWLLVLLPACSLAVGCGQSHGQGGPPPQQAPEVTVSLPVCKQVTDYEDFPGRIEAINAVEIRARVTGFLTKVHFREGADVKQGDLLFEIDDRPYQAELLFAKGNVLQCDGRCQRLELDHRRAMDLRRKNALSQEDFDKVVGDRKEAEGALGMAEGSLEKARLNLDWTKVKAPLAGRISRRFIDPGNMVKADETALTTIMSKDPIYAYFDLDERSTLKARQLLRDKKVKWSPTEPLPLLLGLADEDNVWSLHARLVPWKVVFQGKKVAALLEALCAEPDVRVTPGKSWWDGELNLMLPARLAEPNQFEEFIVRTGLKDVAWIEQKPRNVGFPRRGLIEFADNRVDPDTGTWRLRATFDNPDEALYPGLYVRIRLPVGQPYQATLVSEQALGADQGQKYLYVVRSAKDKDGKTIDLVDYRRVKVGRLHDGLRVITEGLTKDERVVVSGLQRVRPGIEVRAGNPVEMPVITDPDAPPRSEIRNSKSETNPKSQKANPKQIP
jgi:RND family efflux transporter MFP subunit